MPQPHKMTRRLHALSTVLNIDERSAHAGSGSHFDTDSSEILVDNSANVHICNDKKMCVGKLRSCSNAHVCTIGGKNNSPSGLGTVKWTWKNDDGEAHTFEVTNVLYFTESSINILGVTAFANQFDDDTGTGCDTKRYTSRFYWSGNKFSRTIVHPASNLPELSVN